MDHATVTENLRSAAALLSARADDRLFVAAVADAAARMAAAFRRGGKVIACGNGGSMSDAAHFAEELTGRFRDDRPALPAIAVTDPGHLTCVANDYGFEHVFARFVSAHGRTGDVLLAISTSGTSANVLAAAREAAARGMDVVALTGRAGSPLAAAAAVEICAEAGADAGAAQQVHIVAIHSMIEGIEGALFGPGRR